MPGNSNSGRRPKPIPLRALEGTNKRPLPEEVPTRPLPEKPAELCGKGSEFWDWLVDELGYMGVLASADRALMTRACWHYHFSERAKDEMLSNDILYESFTALDAEGNVVDPGSHRATRAVVHRKENPANKVWDREDKALERCLTKFGMSPSDRARLARGPARKRESLLTG